MDMDKVKKILTKKYANAPRGVASIIDIIVDAVALSKIPDDEDTKQITQMTQYLTHKEEAYPYDKNNTTII